MTQVDFIEATQERRIIKADDTVFVYVSPNTPASELIRFINGDLAFKRPDDVHGGTISYDSGSPDSRNAVLVDVMPESVKLDNLLAHPFVVAVTLNEGSVEERILFDVNQGGIIPQALEKRI